MIKTEIITDSINPEGHRLTTLECTFHRFILPEVNTYRMWSRSASSSRAIPLAKRIEEVRTHPAMPVQWGKNQRGMVADEVLDQASMDECIEVWLEAASAAADYAEYLGSKKLHKQIAVRILEPFLWQTMVITSTDYQNMFNQRIHPDAQPEFRILAETIQDAYDASTPETLAIGDWHLPFVTAEEKTTLDIETQKQVSVARVARTSYGNQGGNDVMKDKDLFQRLFNADPKHYAPFEHVATPCSLWPTRCAGNFKGWRQLRHLI